MRMGNAFARLGHDVVLHAWRGDDRESDVHALYGVSSGFSIECYSRVKLRGVSTLAYALAVGKRVRRMARPQVFYGRYSYGLLAVSGLGIPIAYEVHMPPEHRLQAAAERLLFQRRNFVRLVTISQALKEAYLTKFPELRDEQILVAHDGADPISESADLPRENFGALAGRRTGALQVGYVGHLYRGKGMEIIAALAPACPDIDFHVVGGEERDIAAWKSLVSSPNLHFHGFVPNRQVSQILRQFDIVLAPYQRRVSPAGNRGDIGRFMSPLKVFEYMSAGVPIVASGLPVLREILENERNALLVAFDDVTAWQSALRRLERLPDLRRSLAAAALGDFERCYTWRARARRVLDGI
jgi:glycosyltransferase involved in cell wall biosynthesis